MRGVSQFRQSAGTHGRSSGLRGGKMSVGLQRSGVRTDEDAHGAIVLDPRGAAKRAEWAGESSAVSAEGDNDANGIRAEQRLHQDMVSVGGDRVRHAR